MGSVFAWPLEIWEMLAYEPRFTTGAAHPCSGTALRRRDALTSSARMVPCKKRSGP